MKQLESVLFCNEAFYSAFSNGDIVAMSNLWAQTNDVSVIHPGWEPLFGREAVLSSWADIVSDGEGPSVICRDPRVVVRNDLATVVGFEEINALFLAATNIFVKQGPNWQVIHHQAAPTRGRPSAEVQSPSSIN